MRRAWVLAFVMGFVGCVTPGAVSCPDGFVCPEGLVCATVAAQNYCVEATQVGCIENSPCLGDMGTCHENVCLPNICGNGLVDTDEVCDDGNTVDDDDTCSATCQSTNACGNGTIDAIKGETCDSGVPGLSGDGCASTCTLEALGWRDVSPRGLEARYGPTLAYDDTHDRLWLFGGETANELTAETWEFVTQTWIRRTVGSSPPGRTLAAMTYDAARDEVVLFGGIGTSVLNDTWVFDGEQWTQKQTSVAPKPRFSPTMAYHRARGEVLLYGGSGDPAGDYNETFVWNGTAWTQQSGTHPPNSTGKIAYDEERQEIVYYGNFETWIWNGSWSLKTITGVPPTVSQFKVMAWDATQKVIVGHWNGGYTYTWNGSGWAPVAATDNPDAADGAAMASYDGVPIFVGGSSFAGSTQTFHKETWQFTGADWSVVPGNYPSPPARHSHALAYDSRHGRIMLFGGADGNCTRFGDTWVWSDGSWLLQSGIGVLQYARAAHGMAYDSVRDRMVVFGGTDSVSCYGVVTQSDTLEWDGTQWVQVATTGPMNRRYPAMAFDREAGVIVMFGGGDSYPSPSKNDTWTWNGTVWTQKTPSTSPPAREGAAMAYDPVRERIVMFGGTPSMAAFGGMDDTWEWDGTNWTELNPPMKPGKRSAATMNYDPGRGTIVLAGGRGEAASGVDEVWEWNGTTWKQLAPRGTPGPITYTAYNDVEQRLIAYGDFNYEAVSDDTWALDFSTPLVGRQQCIPGAADEDGDGLTGCGDPDCWARCMPLCPPGTTCPASAPQCGNGTCDPLENRAICDADCN